MIHFDGDALVYIAGFAADSRNGPFSHSAHNIKLIINKVLKATNEDEFRVFLTHKDPKVNFRAQVSSSYKQNRAKVCKCGHTEFSRETYVDRVPTKDGFFKRRMHSCLKCGEPKASTKPVYYNRIREFLIKKYNATVCKWGEADDWLAVGEPDWIATHDKDIYQVGNMNFFNLKSDEMLGVEGQKGRIWLKETQIKNKEGVPQFNKNGTPKLRKEIKGYGFKWFCVQMLFGDRIDNIIKPVSGDGPVWIENVFGPLETNREYWNMVKFYYQSSGNADKLWDMAKLLWVAREKQQICSPEVIEDYL